MHAGTAVEQPLHHHGDGRQHVLAVVDHEQRRRRPQHRHQLIDEAPARGLHQPGRRRHHVADTVGVDNGGEVDPPHAVGEPVDQLGGDLLGEAGLADPAGAGHRDQPLIGGEATQLGQLRDPSDQRGRRARQIVTELVERPQRGEVVGEIGMNQLPHPLGTGQIAQVVHAEIAECRVGGQMIGHQPGGDVRQKHLAPMGTGPQPCTTDHRVTHVIAPVAQLCLAGVDRHPHLDAGHLLRQRPLHIHRRRDRIRRPRERGHHAVALALLDGTHPTMSGDTLVDHGVVAGDDRPGRVRRPLPQPRRPLDVGQQECDRACRHHERRRLCHLHLHDQRFSRHRKVSHPHTMRQTSALNIHRWMETPSPPNRADLPG